MGDNIRFGLDAYCLITSKPNERIVRYSKGITLYLYQILNFMIMQSEFKPFPFNEWPGDDKSLLEKEKNNANAD